MRNKIRCICPCCGQKAYVSIEIFEDLQKFALRLGTFVKVIPDEEEEYTEKE